MSATGEPTTHCLICGYDRLRLEGHAPCPECGVAPSPDAPAACRRAFAHPLRRALRQLLLRPAPLGWWHLLPAEELRLTARVQLVAGLTASVLLLAAWLAGGGLVVVVADMKPAAVRANVQEGYSIFTVSMASLAGAVRADAPWRAPLRGREDLRVLRDTDPPRPPWIETLRPSWSPYLAAQVAWLSCASALAFLALRFILLPLAVRVGQGARTKEAKAAAAIAADASVGSAALAYAASIVVLGAACFLLALLAPRTIAGSVANASPLVVWVAMAVVPPILVANDIRSDRSRRIFPAPILTAVVAAATYLGAAALALVMMGAVYNFTARYLASG